MENLLKAIVEAHGGPKNWAATSRITARMSLGGPFWAARGWAGVYDDVTVTLDTHREHITFSPFGSPDHVSTLDVDPERVSIATSTGITLEERVNPRESFPSAFTLDTPWDAIQVAYFTSAAVWNYLTVPFVFTMPGVQTRELDDWNENGQSWRRLAVRFPKTNANHNADQVFYFDSDFMQTRMDYSPDVTGSPPVAHYCHDPKTFDGFVFPTRRRVLLHDERGVADQTFVPISIDITSVAVERR
jgi:hypothetical protein